ncbi:MAG: hypothetical protein AAGH70_10180 [Pseudomonadota bacterium]
MGWLTKHAQALQALGALLTAAFAIVALLGVKLQLDGSERIARESQAREIYRSFLSLSLANPELASPGTCPAFNEDDATAYDFYMEYALYTAEQVIDMDSSWTATFEEIFASHTTWLCDGEFSGYTAEVEQLILGFQTSQCPAQPVTCS